MSDPDEEFGSTLRQLLLEAAEEIHPTRRAPSGDGIVTLRTSTDAPAKQHGLRRARQNSSARPLVPRFLVVSFVALIVIVGAALTISVRHSSSGPPASGGDIPGELVVVRSSGVVEVMNPNTGAVMRTIVGSSPMSPGGKHLGTPFSVAVGGKVAYLTYLTQNDAAGAIYAVPLAGGHLSYVAAGTDAAVSADGSMLAYAKVNLDDGSASGANSAYQSGSFQEIVVRNLKTGSERTVYDPSGTFFSGGLSWSPDQRELLVSGIFGGSSGEGQLPGFIARIGVLSLDKPVSSGNPRFIWSDQAQSALADPYDAKFIGRGGMIGVLSNTPSSGCAPMSTSLLTLDPITGIKTPVTTLHFKAVDAQYGPAGQLVAVTGFLPHCSAPTATTVSPTATTLHQLHLRVTQSTGASGGSTSSTLTGASNPPSLYKWEGEAAVKIAGKVQDIAYLPTS
jgi:hypothetical protein